MRVRHQAGLLAALLAVSGAVAFAQGRAPRPLPPSPRAAVCLHGPGETTSERQRRDDALDMLHLTDRAVAMTRPFRRVPGAATVPYPAWNDVAARAMQLGRMDGG